MYLGSERSISAAVCHTCEHDVHEQLAAAGGLLLQAYGHATFVCGLLDMHRLSLSPSIVLPLSKIARAPYTA